MASPRVSGSCEADSSMHKEEVVAKEGVAFEEGIIPVVHVSDDELHEWSKPWQRTLIVNVFGIGNNTLNYSDLQKKVNKDWHWQKKSSVQIINLSKGYYAVHFVSEAEYNRALFQGACVVSGHWLIIQRWRPNFMQSASTECKVAVWVKIPEIPVELYHEQFLGRLASALGTYLKKDPLSSVDTQPEFARICVEVDLAKPLIHQVVVRGHILKVEYELSYKVCLHCRVYGHFIDECPEKKYKNK